MDREPMTQQQTERERLIRLVKCILENDPNEPIADNGMTVLDLWRQDAAALLRGDEPSKSDRYVEIWRKAKYEYTLLSDDQAAAAVLRKHFEPSAEVIEAARLVKKNYSGGAYPHSVTLADHILKGDIR